MSRFLESEKPEQIRFKITSPTFSDPAHEDGIYKNNPYAFCLPVECSEQNLFPEIRQPALSFFADRQIKWHDGQNGKPSNHLCSSQVACVNFLFPLADKPDALARVLRTVFPEINQMLPVENGLYVSFEWIGAKNYLGERMGKNAQRTRGANFTSADAIVMFERKDKRRQIVLIEWKYTESYGGAFLKIAASGTDRTTIYQHLFNKPDCPINKEILPDFDSLFYEPFYQFMRQQLLAHKMEKIHEMDADIVSVLHIAPAHNPDFRKVTSPKLVSLGDSATEVWKKLVIPEGRFISVSTEKLFNILFVEAFPSLEHWIKYIQDRYTWVRVL